MISTSIVRVLRGFRGSRARAGRCVTVVALTIGAVLAAAPAAAGISSIQAHNETFGASDTIPVFVDPSEASSIMVKGQFMDLCTGVESSDPSFSVRIGRRIRGPGSAVEILVGAANAPHGDGATVRIKFALGEESFKVKAHRVVISRIVILGKTDTSCKVGESVLMGVTGEGLRNLDKGLAGTMLDVADGRYEFGPRMGTNTETLAQFALKCTAEGQFTVKRTWFRDSSLGNPEGDAMVRGSGTMTVTVQKADPVIRRPVK